MVKASALPQAYPLLPDILALLEQIRSMLLTEAMDLQSRQKFVGALGRLVTEDVAFSEGELGGKLLEFGNDLRYAKVDSWRSRPAYPDDSIDELE